MDPSLLQRFLPFGVLALLVHLLIAVFATVLWPHLRLDASDSMTLTSQPIVLQPHTPVQPITPEQPDKQGQIVEIAKPEEQKAPDESDYLAEFDQTVPEESRSERFKINPEVVTPKYSEDSRLELENLMDLHVTEPSTGATVGDQEFKPDRDGSLASLPSPWTLTNREGLDSPVPASHFQANIAGAPQNDLLDEKRGEQVSLNTKEFLYANYLNRIRRMVSFYWEQNLANMPRTVRLARPRYHTIVHSILDKSGNLQSIEVAMLSGSRELDSCVVRAFHLAGPFPHPPAGLIDDKGLVELPEMGFTVIFGRSRSQYQGIDPRVGVQFPGILKAPR
jgi:outer membrane biosynthesis protein TonB